MSDDELYGNYLEALRALGTAPDRQREALRKAVADAAAVTDRSRTQLAGQQRNFDRAGKDVQEAERLLAELRSMLGLRPAAPPAPARSVGDPPQLAEVRGKIGDIARWAEEARPVAESLLRTKQRLANRPQPAQPAIPAAAGPAPPRPRPPVGALLVGVALVVIVIVVVLIAH